MILTNSYTENPCLLTPHLPLLVVNAPIIAGQDGDFWRSNSKFSVLNGYPLVIKHGNGNGPFLGDFPIRTSINRGFSIAITSILTSWFLMLQSLDP